MFFLGVLLPTERKKLLLCCCNSSHVNDLRIEHMFPVCIVKFSIQLCQRLSKIKYYQTTVVWSFVLRFTVSKISVAKSSKTGFIKLVESEHHVKELRLDFYI